MTEWVGTAQYGFGDKRCLICGWYQLETFNLIPQDVLLRNQEALAHAMVHTVTGTQEDGIEVNEETNDLHIVGDLDLDLCRIKECQVWMAKWKTCLRMD
jgi:hypothetical protein